MAVEANESPADPGRYEIHLVRLAQVLLWPIAAPAWLVEHVASRRGSSFQFGVLSSVPYFVTVTALATSLVVLANSWLLSVIGLTLLFMQEVLGLGTALSIGLGRGSTLERLLRAIARRRPTKRRFRRKLDTAVASIVALGYTTWFFAALFFHVHRYDRGQLSGLPTDLSPLATFWASFYLSATTITTAGSQFTATGGTAQLLTLIEITIGLVFFVFVLAAVVARLTE